MIEPLPQGLVEGSNLAYGGRRNSRVLEQRSAWDLQKRPGPYPRCLLRGVT